LEYYDGENWVLVMSEKEAAAANKDYKLETTSVGKDDTPTDEPALKLGGKAAAIEEACERVGIGQRCQFIMLTDLGECDSEMTGDLAHQGMIGLVPVGRLIAPAPDRTTRGRS